MKTLNPLKVPFGAGKFSRISGARFLQWENAFEVDFEDGLSFLEPHKTILKANGIADAARIQSVEIEIDTRSGFYVHYDNGQTAEISWAFIRELPPKKPSKN